MFCVFPAKLEIYIICKMEIYVTPCVVIHPHIYTYIKALRKNCFSKGVTTVIYIIPI